MSFVDHFHQRLLSLPERETIEFPRNEIPADSKPAAVLMCFWPTQDERVEVLLTQRTHKVSSHQGQVSFPGGRVDTGESFEDAALRETWEELGIAAQLITIMGRLDDAWSRYGHHVIPFVGWLQQRPPLNPNPHEVAQVLIADMATVMQPQARRDHEVVLHHNGQKQIHTAQAFAWDGGYVWGLTADLLLELILWINEQPSNRGDRRLERMRKLGV
jgi:8-oxo-dGTP pyrophosphatase MutT (NUDIX family)